MHDWQINAQRSLIDIMHEKHINTKVNQHDDIGLEIPHVETNLISTTCNRWWIFEV